MDIRDPRYFLALSDDEGSLLAAAKRLGITASTLSQQTYEMEEELRVKLLIRKRGSIELTVAGRIMRSHGEEHTQIHFDSQRRRAKGRQRRLSPLAEVFADLEKLRPRQPTALGQRSVAKALVTSISFIALRSGV